MSVSSITILFPHPVPGPTGGYKVLYEYANRFVATGTSVNIVYSGSIFWKQKALWFKFTNCIRYVEHLIRGYKANRWFPLDSRVKEYLSLSLNYRHVPQSDAYIATSPYTAYYLKDYPISKERKFYFIQDYEDWGPGLRAILENTYHAPLNKIVISTWLQKRLKEQFHEESSLVRNGFDKKTYHITIPIEQKEKSHLTMMWHTMERKGTKYGLEAIFSVKKKYPSLRVTMFGSSPRPAILPEWIDYLQSPDPQTHLQLNNQAAIYVAPALSEGWGLTIGEAMMCGQAVACTDIDGYKEMAVNGRNALLSPAGYSVQLSENIWRLISDDALRTRIARQGTADIAYFDIEDSFKRFKEIIDTHETAIS